MCDSQDYANDLQGRYSSSPVARTWLEARSYSWNYKQQEYGGEKDFSFHKNFIVQFPQQQDTKRKRGNA